MIEEALLQHLQNQATLSPYLTTYSGTPAVFSQEAPADVDPLWASGTQYGRIVFDVDMQGDPERTMGGLLTVDILCQKDKQFPEDIEPIVRDLIHGYFFTTGTFTAAAQWKNSAYFSEPTDEVIGCTMTFDLLAFPVLTSYPVDVIERINEWCAALEGIHVINHDELPGSAWKPSESESAVYWRLVREDPAKWIPDTFQTIWRTAILKCHVFSQDIATALSVTRDIRYRLYAAKRLMRDGESPIMVNRNNTVDPGADPLRTGQLTVEATFGEIVRFANENVIQVIGYRDNEDERRQVDGDKNQRV